MATGDHILTAISIAKECLIISQTEKVYMGELVEDNENNEKYILWTKKMTKSDR